jgi:hypothetical protein
MATGRVPTTANSPLTAKGDLFGYSTTQARVAVGNDGETLVADSSTSTGLRYTNNFAAGKNKIINGDFAINQRGFSSTTTPEFGFDRWVMFASDGTSTYSSQSFTPGSAPVAGYEATNFLRLESTGQTLTTATTRMRQNIEDVRTFAGQTVTVSFWAKASTGTPNIAVNLNQIFGSGGSSAVLGTAQKFAITNSWVRYFKTFSIASISGKTIGTNSLLGLNLWISAGSDSNAQTDSLGIQSVTIDFWGVQVEAGSVATAFQTATGTLQGELAACHRYYYRTTASATYSYFQWVGPASSTTGIRPVGKINTMRITPTSIDWGNLGFDDEIAAVIVPSAITLSTNSTPESTVLIVTVTGATSGRWYKLVANNNSAAFIGFSAEL